MSKIKLHVISVAKTPDLSVSLSIPFHCSKDYISILKSNYPYSGAISAGAEEAAIAFALYHLMLEKMVRAPLEISKHKISHITCAAHGKYFVISWNTQGTGSALRKTAGTAIKCLKPHSLFQSYSHNIRAIGGKPDRSVFNFLANKMLESINSGVDLVAIGKINPKVEVKPILEAIQGKLDPGTKVSDSAAPEKRPELESNYHKIECENGVAAILVADYIMAAKVEVRICDKEITVANPNFATKQKQYKENRRIQDYFNAKYSRLGDAATSILAFYANSSAMGYGDTILKLIKEKNIVSIIHKNL